MPPGRYRETAHVVAVNPRGRMDRDGPGVRGGGKERASERAREGAIERVSKREKERAQRGRPGGQARARESAIERKKGR